MDDPTGGPGFYGRRCRKHRLSLLGIEFAVAAQIVAVSNIWAEWMTSRKRGWIAATPAPVITVSPIVAGDALKGPAAN